MQQPLTSRVVDLFLELCAIPSPPGEERAVADRLTAELDRLGLAWEEDDAAARLGSSTGNIVCRLPGATDGGVPLFLCAHLDTVPLDGRLDPVIDEDGIVRNAGGTILGADNKSAVVSMLEAARRVVEEGRRHGGVELVFTPKEVTAKVGDTIEWINKDNLAHTATVKGGWEVMIPAKKTGSFVVEAPGSFDYYCRLHPNMKARLTVAAP